MFLKNSDCDSGRSQKRGLSPRVRPSAAGEQVGYWHTSAVQILMLPGVRPSDTGQAFRFWHTKNFSKSRVGGPLLEILRSGRTPAGSPHRGGTPSQAVFTWEHAATRTTSKIFLSPDAVPRGPLGWARPPTPRHFSSGRHHRPGALIYVSQKFRLRLGAFAETGTLAQRSSVRPRALGRLSAHECGPKFSVARRSSVRHRAGLRLLAHQKFF